MTDELDLLDSTGADTSLWVPDYSPLAIAHLHSNCVAVRELIKQYLSTTTPARLNSLVIAVREIHHTLLLLQRPGAAMMTTELLALLQAIADRRTSDDEAVANTLVMSGDTLADYIAYLRRPDAIDSALPLLSMLNNCRACRGEELLSEILVMASGISLPDATALSVPGELDVIAFRECVRASRQPLMQGLLGWFRNNEGSELALQSLSSEFFNLSAACAPSTLLHVLQPLFDSAGVICLAVKDQKLANSAALNRLFAQLERLLGNYAQADLANSASYVSEQQNRLLLNLLYYVAISGDNSPESIALRRRFRLDRFSPKNVAQKAADNPAGFYQQVGERLGSSIRSSILRETDATRQWLLRSTNTIDPSDAVELAKRLEQVGPAFTLLGAIGSSQHLRHVVSVLKQIGDVGRVPTTSDKSELAEALLRLERTLDDELSVQQPPQTSLASVSSNDHAEACVVEAQRRIHVVEDALVNLFFTAELPLQKSATDPLDSQDVSVQLAQIDSALQILPLPEVTPIFNGLQAFVERYEGQQITTAQQGHLATLLVALGYYLDSVLQPASTAGPILMDAENALLNLFDDVDTHSDNDFTQCSGTAHSHQSLADLQQVNQYGADEPTVDLALDAEFDNAATVIDETLSLDHSTFYSDSTQTQSLDRNVSALDAGAIASIDEDQPAAKIENVDALIDVSLAQLSQISSAVVRLGDARSHGDTSAIGEQCGLLEQAYCVISVEAKQSGATDLHTLAQANISFVSDVSVVAQLPQAQRMLEESVAVLPQLINQLQSPTARVRDLSHLLDEFVATDDAEATIVLQDAAFAKARVSDATDEVSEEPIDSTVDGFVETALRDSSGGTDGDSRDDIFDNTAPTSLTLDQTLEQVFYRECQQHINTLKTCVQRALQSNASGPGVDLTGNQPQSGAIAAEHALPNRDMLRALHTLTGSAQTVDAHSIISIAQPLQRAVLNKQRNGDVFDRNETCFIAELIDVIDQRLVMLESGPHAAPAGQAPGNDQLNSATIEQKLAEFVAHAEPFVPERKPGLAIGKVLTSLADVFDAEAQELLGTMRSAHKVLSDTGTHADAAEGAWSTIKLNLHTLKGSARMAGYSALATRAHELEDQLHDTDAAAVAVLDTGLAQLHSLLLDEQSMSITTNSATVDVAHQVAKDEFADGPVVDVAITDQVVNDALVTSALPVLTDSSMLHNVALDDMLSLATRATVSQAALGDSLQRLRDAYRDLESSASRLQSLPHGQVMPDATNAALSAMTEMLADLDTARRSLAEALLDAESEQQQGARADSAIQQALIRSRLISVDESSARLKRAAADAATASNKQVRFKITGAALAIDRGLYKQILAPLEHLVRNAVVHGIEHASERTADGKPACGTITLHVQTDANDLLLSVEDDGAGIDKTAVNRVRKASGLKVVRTVADLLPALCESGFSTGDEADQLQGRGQGLAVVQHMAQQLDGTLRLSYRRGSGSTFTLRVPQKVVVNQIILVVVDSQRYALPVSAVRTVQEASAGRPSNLAPVMHEAQQYQHCTLAELLGGGEPYPVGVSRVQSTFNRTSQTVLLDVAEQHLALKVDEVLGYREIIAQPVGDQLASLKQYAGGSVLADGTPVLIPDLQRLAASLQLTDSQRVTDTKMSRSATATSVLIVDDSVTMRVAAQQLLTELGIESSCARDGHEALELLKEQLPDVLLVDIDMPRMDGFDFLRHLRVLHPDHNTPVIMISTRTAAADRLEARALGAGQYLRKPYTKSQLVEALQAMQVLADQD